MKPEQRKLADAGGAAKIREYGLAASGVSCQTQASRGGNIVDEIVCTPRKEAYELLLKRCVRGD